MKKFLLFLTMACLIPFWGQSQETSALRVDKSAAVLQQEAVHAQQVARTTDGKGHSTVAYEAAATNTLSEMDAEKMAEIQKAKSAVVQTNAGVAPAVNGVAYNTGNFRGETSEAIISIGGQDLYHFTLNDPAGAVAYGTSGPEFLNSAEYLDGQFYIASSTTGKFYQCDPATGDITVILSSGAPYASLAYNPADGQMYGILLGASSNIYTVDVTSGASSLVTAINSANFLLGVAIDNTGRMFVIDAEIDGISEINMTTGDIISSKPAGFTINYGQDVDVDRELNQLYWAAFNADALAAQLYKVNFDEGAYELIGTFANQASCFASVTTNNPNLPGAPTNVVAVAGPDGEMYVDLSWTNPTTTIGGDPLTQINTIVLKRKGVVIQEFTDVTPGQEMTYHDADIAQAGTYTYSVQAINDEGNGGSASSNPVVVGSMCAYTVTMVDSFGDGWNGASLNFVSVDGTVLGSCTVPSGSSGTAEILLPKNVIVNLVWTPGSYDGECSFNVFFPWGDVLYSHPAGSAPVAGILTSWTNTCQPPTCPKPTNFAVVAGSVTVNTVTLSWTENGEAASWEIQYGPKGFILGEGTTVEVAENPYTLEGLESGTTYDAYVRAICGPDDISDWSALVSFATPVECPEGFTAVLAQIGNGTTGTYQMPMNTFYNFSYVQELFTNAELSEQGAFFGEINTLSFEYTYATPVTPQSLTILMQNTEAADMSAGWILDDMQVVYQGSPVLENGWVEILLDAPFTYDGGSNLVVTFVYALQPYVGSQQRFLTHTTTAKNARILYNDGSAYDPFAPSAAGTASTNRNNMRFGMCITEPEFATVSGVVTSSYTNQPVAGASVKFAGALGSTVTTDENGEYSLDIVQLFNYNVTINADGFNPYTEVITAPAAESFTKNFAINQPDMELDPQAIEKTAYFMQTATEEITITNDGTGYLEWNAKAYMDDEEKAEDSPAHVVITGTGQYNFSLTDPAAATAIGLEMPEFCNSGVWADGVAYFTSSTSGLFGTIDYEAASYEVISSGNPSGGITYYAAEQQLYGAFLGAGCVVYTIDETTGEQTQAFAVNSQDFILGIVFDNNGRLFAIDAEIDGIAEIDPATGDLTTFITGGFTINYGQDAELDHETNTLYWAAFNADAFQAQLYAIPVDDPSMTMLGAFADQASCLVIETSAGAGPWLSVAPKSGVVAPGETGTFVVSMDGWRADQGTFTGRVEVSNNTIDEMTAVPVTFHILPPACDAPTNFVGEIVDFNNASLTWTPTAGAIAYNLYYGEDREPFAVVEDAFYIDETLKPGVYTYKVRAIYEDGCISASPEPVVLEAFQPYRPVSGVVTSSLTNNPVEGAIVTFAGSTYLGARTIVATTDANGAYSCNVFDGEYGVTVAAAGYNTASVVGLVVEDVAIENYNFALAQPMINVDPTTVDVHVGYMGQGVAEITLTNNGTGDLVWGAATSCDDKHADSYAICAIGGQDMYEFTLSDPAGTSALGFAAAEFLNSAVYVDGVYYFASSTTGMFGIIDLDAKAFNVLATGQPSGGIGYDVASGTVYGAFLGAGAVIYTVDLTTGQQTQAFALNSQDFILGIEFDNNGRMFAIDAEIDGIAEIDRTTGNVTTFATGGFTINYGQDMAVDREENILYWAAFNADAFAAQLYSINPDDATMTFLGTFADQTSGFAIESTSGWMKAQPNAGVVAAGETGTFELLMDGWLAEEGVFTGSCTINNNTITPSIVLPVTFTITPPNCDPVQNFAGEVQDYNDVVLTWNEPADAEGLLAYGVYYGEDKVPFATVDPAETTYTDWDKPEGDYTYRVRAMYDDGCVSQSLEAITLHTTKEYGIVAGYITDAADGSPIEGAEVRFTSTYKTYTDEDGAYEIELLTGNYSNVKISATNYVTAVVPEYTVVIYDNTLDVALESKFAPAKNVVATVDEDNVTVTWEAPEGGETPVVYLIEEGYEDAVAGQPAAQQLGSPWTTWSSAPGGAEDAVISSDQAYEGNNSMHLTYGNDVVCDFGDIAEGHYFYNNHFYVPAGKTGYFNILHDFAGTASAWACEIYFDADGTGRLNAGVENAATFTFPSDQWFNVNIDIDIDNDWTILVVNDVEVYSWPFHYEANLTTGTSKVFSASDFFPPTDANSEYYMDYLTVQDVNFAKGAKDVLLSESFDNGIPETWLNIDADGDGYFWADNINVAFNTTPHSGDGLAFSQSYENLENPGLVLTPDNWLITPELAGAEVVNYWVAAQDASYPADHYGVYASTSGTDIADFELCFEETLTAKGGSDIIGFTRSGAKVMGTWYERTVELPAGTKYVAYRHFDCTDQFIMVLDDITISGSGVTPPSSELSGYMISRNGEEIATVDPTVLTYTESGVADGEYTYCVTAVYGEFFAPAVCAEEVTVGGGTVLLGDANNDGFVQISDIQTIIAYILMQNPSPFNFVNADVNQDGVVNIPDVQGVISIILSGFKGNCETTEVSYTVENGVLYMINNGPVSAFQISLSGDNFKALESFDSWTTAEGMTEDGYLFLAYNLDGKEFAAGKHALLAVNETVNSVLVSDPCANAIICKNILGLGENVTVSAAYPNPFSTTVTLNYTANEDSNVEFVVTSMVGQVVYRSNSNNGTFTWTPSNVSNGVYFINVYVNGERAQVSKVVYQK